MKLHGQSMLAGALVLLLQGCAPEIEQVQGKSILHANYKPHCLKQSLQRIQLLEQPVIRGEHTDLYIGAVFQHRKGVPILKYYHDSDPPAPNTSMIIANSLAIIDKQTGTGTLRTLPHGMESFASATLPDGPKYQVINASHNLERILLYRSGVLSVFDTRTDTLHDILEGTDERYSSPMISGNGAYVAYARWPKVIGGIGGDTSYSQVCRMHIVTRKEDCSAVFEGGVEGLYIFANGNKIIFSVREHPWTEALSNAHSCNSSYRSYGQEGVKLLHEARGPPQTISMAKDEKTLQVGLVNGIRVTLP
jgi:hypothetical protein